MSEEATPRIWVLVAQSCQDCNKMGAQAFAHSPSDEEERELTRSLGGMWCIQVRRFLLEADGEPVKQRMSED